MSKKYIAIIFITIFALMLCTLAFFQVKSKEIQPDKTIITDKNGNIVELESIPSSSLDE
ncbi:hypothetical protein A5881_003841 [Enterococcus termitis]